MKVTYKGKIFLNFFVNSLLFISLYRILSAKINSKKIDLNYFIDEFFVLIGVSYLYMFLLFIYNIVLMIKNNNKTYLERELDQDMDSDDDNNENEESRTCVKTNNYTFKFYNRFDIWNTENSDDDNDSDDNNNKNYNIDEDDNINFKKESLENNNSVLCDCNDCINLNNSLSNKKSFGLAERMKSYEKYNKNIILPYESFIVRIDGCNFSKLTKNFFQKPVDTKFSELMLHTAYELFKEFKATIVHVTSDEISLVFNCKCDKKEYNLNPTKYQHIFAGKTHKILSIIPSFATNSFMKNLKLNNIDIKDTNISFDSRLIVTPQDKDYEIINYLYLRSTIDSYRNSVSMYCCEFYKNNELLNISVNSRIELLKNRLVDFSNIPNNLKYGWFIKNKLVDKEDIDIKYQRKKTVAFSFELKYSDLIKDKFLSKYLSENDFSDINNNQYYEF